MRPCEGMGVGSGTGSGEIATETANTASTSVPICSEFDSRSFGSFRLVRALVLGNLLLLGVFVWALFSLSERERAGGGPCSSALLAYWVSYAALWLLLSVFAWSIRKIDHRLGRSWRSAAFILLVAAVVRFSVVFTSQPTLSDDIWRYVHDGNVLGNLGRNPYENSPEEMNTQWPVNHAHLVTIYQPTSQCVFSLCARLKSVEVITAFRSCFSLVDLGIVTLLLIKLRNMKRSSWWAALYAWHPLPISEVAATGHQDVIGIACLIVALLLLDIVQNEPRGRFALVLALGAGISFSLAIGVKPLIAPLAVPVAWFLRREKTLAIGVAVSAVVTVVALYLPFLLMEGGLGGMQKTIAMFMETWAFNGSLHPLTEFLVGSKSVADRTMGMGILAALFLVTVTSKDLWRAALFYLVAFLLLSSTVHPWYLLWALPLIVVRFNPILWVLGLTASWSYAVLIDSSTFRLPIVVGIIEYLPVYGTAAWQLGYLLRCRTRLCTGN